MTTIYVKDFLGGIDSRRLPISTPGGALLQCDNAHINRGGEVEQRKSFVPVYSLPPGVTKGLAATLSGLTVFGTAAGPVGVPVGVQYQQIVNAQNPAATLQRLMSYDLFAGQIYAIGLYSDARLQHFYNGVNVGFWNDCRAFSTLQVSGGGAPVAAKASFTLSGTAGSVSAVTLDGIAITSGSVAYAGSAADTAAAVVANINGYSAIAKATAVGAVVTVTYNVAGASNNGKALLATTSGGLTATGTANTAGGLNAGVMSDLAVGPAGLGVRIIGQPVTWTNSNEYTASLIASEINDYLGSPRYRAYAVGSVVYVKTYIAGTAANGAVFTITQAGNITVTAGGPFANGAAQYTDTASPGDFALTIGTKVYSVSNSLIAFSGSGNATGWIAGANAGAGSIDMSTLASGADTLTSIAVYQRYTAIFSTKTTVVYYFDADPTQNQLFQTLANTGTDVRRSTVQFGDADLFYLDTTIRSLKPRDSSNAAVSDDIGTAVDTLVQAVVKSFPSELVRNAISIIEPLDKRYWLFIGNRVFVFSFFQSSKVSAWSTYTLPFTVDDAVIFQKKIWVRSGETIYVYGGLNGTTYTDPGDIPIVTAQLPFLAANQPAKVKRIDSIEAAVRGDWEISLGMNPSDNPTAWDLVAEISQPTYDLEMLPAIGQSTHFSMLFKSRYVPQAIGAPIQSQPFVLSMCSFNFMEEAG